MTSFLVQNNLRKLWFFEETFLLADIRLEIVLILPFLILNNADVEFTELKKLTWRFYIVAKALYTTSWVKLINKMKFVKAALNENSKIFVVYAAALKAEASIHLPQIAQIAALQWNKAPTKILVKYYDYIDVFSSDLDMMLCENIEMNEYAIELIDRKKPP